MRRLIKVFGYRCSTSNKAEEYVHKYSSICNTIAAQQNNLKSLREELKEMKEMAELAPLQQIMFNLKTSLGMKYAPKETLRIVEAKQQITSLKFKYESLKEDGEKRWVKPQKEMKEAKEARISAFLSDLRNFSAELNSTVNSLKQNQEIKEGMKLTHRVLERAIKTHTTKSQ